MSTLAITPRLSRGTALPHRRRHVSGHRAVAPVLAVAPVVPVQPPAPVARRRAVRAVAQPPAQLRLTRRGRAVLLLALLTLVTAAAIAFGPSSAATSEMGTPVRTQTVQVGEGDTLWSIAADVAGPGQVRETVHRIEELNALSGPGLTVGQEIAVPVG